MENLENKVKQEKYDWREWLPVWGLYQMHKDNENGKTTIAHEKFSKYAVHAVYQVASLYGTLFGLIYLADKF